MNNNIKPSSYAKCYCGRRATIGEELGMVSYMSYICPTCFNTKYSRPITRDEYYKKFSEVLK